MAKTKVDLKKELLDLYFEALFLQRIDCSKEDNKKYQQLIKNNEPLPKGIYPNAGIGTFYTVYKPELTQEQKLEYIAFKQLKMISTIQNCIVFFTTLTVISMIITFFAILKFFALMK